MGRGAFPEGLGGELIFSIELFKIFPGGFYQKGLEINGVSQQVLKTGGALNFYPKRGKKTGVNFFCAFTFFWGLGKK